MNILIVVLLFVSIILNLINMATQKELTDQINALTGIVVKVGSETRTLLTKIEELLAQIGNEGEVSAELQTAVNDLQAQVDVVDALVPDTTEPTP